MRDEAFDSDPGGDWNPVALQGGVASLRVPASWQRVSRDDGGLAFQSPGPHPVDLLISATTYRNPYGVRADDAIQYLDRENMLPPGITPSEDEGVEEARRWLAYAVAQPPDRQIFVWKVADFQPPDHVRVVALQLHVPAVSAAQPDLAALIDRLGEEAARIQFHPTSLPGPVQRVTMRNVAHGDQVRFRLPWDWRTRPDEELSLFFREEDGTGTLRVAVHSFDHEGDEAEILARVALRQTAEQFAEGPDGRTGEGSLDWMSEGEVIARFVTDGEEDGQKLRFHLWLRGSALDGQTTVALFSFALPQTARGGEMEAAVLAMLEREIRAAIVGPADEMDEDEDQMLLDADGFSLSDLLDIDRDGLWQAGDDDEDEEDEEDEDEDEDEDDEDEDADEEDEPEEGGPVGNA